MSVKARTGASLPPLRPACEEALRERPKHRRRSLAITFGTDCLCWPHRRVHTRSPLQTGSQLIKRRSLGYMTNLAEQVVGERHARQRRTRFEPTMQRIRHITNLNHRRHVQNINACGSHVNPLRTCASTEPGKAGPVGGRRRSGVACACRPTRKRRPAGRRLVSRQFEAENSTCVRTVRPSCRRTGRRGRHRRDDNDGRRRSDGSGALAHRPSHRRKPCGSRRSRTAAPCAAAC
jgi:hypothetical protein